MCMTARRVRVPSQDLLLLSERSPEPSAAAAAGAAVTQLLAQVRERTAARTVAPYRSTT